MPFTESLCAEACAPISPAIAPQNESTATAESLRGIVLRSNGFRRSAVQPRASVAVRRRDHDGTWNDRVLMPRTI